MTNKKRVSIPVGGGLQVEVCEDGAVYLSRPASEEPGFALTAEEWGSVVLTRTSALAGFKAGAAR